MRKPPANRILASLILVAAVAGSAAAQLVCQQQRIESPWPTFFFNFGMDVAIWGDTVVAGEPTISDFIAGRAHIFDYDEQQGWTHSQMIVPPDGQGGDRFGRSVSLLDDWCLVAAHQHNHSKGTGAIYAWKRTNGQWSLAQKVVPPETMFSFGILMGTDRHPDTSVNRLWAKGTLPPHVMVVYSEERGSWSHQQTISQRAVSAAMDRDVLVIGDSFDSTPCPDAPPPGWSGLVFVYRWNGESWVEEQALAVPGDPCNRQFGRAVAVYGNTIVATAGPYFPQDIPSQAFVFEYDENSATWVYTATVRSPEANLSTFGWRPRSAAVAGDTLLIGDESSEGAKTQAFVFQRRPDGAWIQRALLKPDGDGGTYGWTVGIHSGRAIVSKFGANMSAGQAYIYDLEPKTGDLNCDGLVNVEDLLLLLNAWGECPSTPYPGTDVLPPCNEDLNHDGHVGVKDLLILLQNWG